VIEIREKDETQKRYEQQESRLQKLKAEVGKLRESQEGMQSFCRKIKDFKIKDQKIQSARGARSFSTKAQTHFVSPSSSP